MYLGWTQVAFESDLTDDVIPVDCGRRALIAVRTDSSFVVYDGRCPHRGAHLGHGGRLDGSFVICPFHGHRIRLGTATHGQFCVRPYRTVFAAGGLFVLFARPFDTGLSERLLGLTETHHVRPAFLRELAVPPEYVVENVFDADHFVTVHALQHRPNLEVSQDPSGSVRVEGQFDAMEPDAEVLDTTPYWRPRLRFSAQVFSPTVVVSELGAGDSANVIITAATPTAGGGCTARVTIALPRERTQGPPTVNELSWLVSGSRTAFDQDALVWEHLDTSMTPRYVAGDAFIQQYREFCARFREPGPDHGE
jgi:nitrite reductase/ring-hydroxylating ferredoxin subunit